MDQKYKELLIKFAGNKELFELLDLVVLDDLRERENEFIKNKKYPDRRDLLGKLKVDLNTVKIYLDSKK